MQSPPFVSDDNSQLELLSESLTLNDVIHRHVQHVLKLNHGNKLRAARQLGIARTTLYRILAGQAILTNTEQAAP